VTGLRASERNAGGWATGQNDGGALSLGYVIIFPAFLLALMLMIQGSVWYLAREAALAAARHGADIARVKGTSPAAGASAAMQFVRSAAPGFLHSPSAWPLCPCSRTVTITVSGHVPVIFPGFTLTVTQSAQAPIEKFTIP